MFKLLATQYTYKFEVCIGKKHSEFYEIELVELALINIVELGAILINAPSQHQPVYLGIQRFYESFIILGKSITEIIIQYVKPDGQAIIPRQVCESLATIVTRELNKALFKANKSCKEYTGLEFLELYKPYVENKLSREYKMTAVVTHDLFRLMFSIKDVNPAIIFYGADLMNVRWNWGSRKFGCVPNRTDIYINTQRKC